MSDFKNFCFFELSVSSRTTMSPSTFLYLVKKSFEIMVGFWSRAIALSDFKNFCFFELSVSSRTTMSPSTFLYLVKKSFEIMVGFWSRAIALSDFKNFSFFELSVSSRTTMSPSTFLYLVKKSFEIMVGFWSRAIALSVLEILRNVSFSNIQIYLVQLRLPYFYILLDTFIHYYTHILRFSIIKHISLFFFV